MVPNYTDIRDFEVRQNVTLPLKFTGCTIFSEITAMYYEINSTMIVEGFYRFSCFIISTLCV